MKRQECACLVRSQVKRMSLVNGATAVIYKALVSDEVLPVSRTQ